MVDQAIINEVISLQAYFLNGYKSATGLRKKLENSTAPASPNGELSAEVKADLQTKRMRSILKKRK